MRKTLRTRGVELGTHFLVLKQTKPLLAQARVKTGALESEKRLTLITFFLICFTYQIRLVVAVTDKKKMVSFAVWTEPESGGEPERLMKPNKHDSESALRPYGLCETLFLYVLLSVTFSECAYNLT